MRKVSIFLLTIVIFICCSLPAFCDNITLYGNLDDSNTACNILIDAYHNDPSYDPFNQFIVLRAGEYDYRLYFGEDIDGNTLGRISFSPQHQYSPASISRSTVTSGVHISDQGYYYVGNIDGTLSSIQATQYKYYYVIIIIACAILFFIIFKVFRRTTGTNARFYSVK